ncbi:MAG: hypothetical protein K6G33_14800 [Ruminococcus sp.]|uniref:hypothetical protein n=1 Tax=Ruminococcus sp. TaxID=41978 RepID=UPI0025EC4637|nr:hypothetical protein [Ruminococcus sp.]MCR5601993.1 hypothetical protein [Ruminococcus sp.]
MGLELDKEQQEAMRRLSIESDIKAADVDRIIEMTSPEPPKRQFSIDIPKQKSGSDRIYLYASATGFACDAVIYLVRKRVSVDNGSLELVLGVVFLIACIVAVFLNIINENTARVIGEELKIGGKNYFTCDIEQIKCRNREVKVISGGKPILKLTKSHEGCDELIRWARAYEIPVENEYTVPSRLFTVLAVVGLTAVFALFILLTTLLLK